MSRSYKIPFVAQVNTSTLTAPVDLVSIIVPALTTIEVTGFTLNDADTGAGLPAGQQIAITAANNAGATNTYSFGSASTPIPDNFGDGNAWCSGFQNGRAAIGPGATGIGYVGGCYITQGLAVTFDVPIVVGALGVFTVTLTGAPVGTLTLTGTISYREIWHS
jgi:hypothetical protein